MNIKNSPQISHDFLQFSQQNASFGQRYHLTSLWSFPQQPLTPARMLIVQISTYYLRLVHKKTQINQTSLTILNFLLVLQILFKEMSLGKKVLGKKITGKDANRKKRLIILFLVQLYLLLTYGYYKLSISLFNFVLALPAREFSDDADSRIS